MYACVHVCGPARVIAQGVDKSILLWEARTGVVLRHWHGVRVHDLAVGSSGARLLATCERGIHVWPLDYVPGGGATAGAPAAAPPADPPRTPVPEQLWIEESEPITSVSLSRDGRHALVNTAGPEVHLWDLARPALVHSYTGHKQGRFVIRTTFGGSDESYVISGSEDSQVYVWARHSGALVDVLPGHSGAVNAVAWHPTRCMFASASDDHTVRVWAPA